MQGKVQTTALVRQTSASTSRRRDLVSCPLSCLIHIHDYKVLLQVQAGGSSVHSLDMYVVPHRPEMFPCFLVVIWTNDNDIDHSAQPKTQTCLNPIHGIQHGAFNMASSHWAGYSQQAIPLLPNVSSSISLYNAQTLLLCFYPIFPTNVHIVVAPAAGRPHGSWVSGYLQPSSVAWQQVSLCVPTDLQIFMYVVPPLYRWMKSFDHNYSGCFWWNLEFRCQYFIIFASMFIREILL